MNRMMDNARLALFALFIVATAGTIAYQAWYIWPMQKCERAGEWWSPRDRVCATPIPIWRITGRLPPTPSPQTEASKTPGSATAR